jgi:hypothetical protein
LPHLKLVATPRVADGKVLLVSPNRTFTRNQRCVAVPRGTEADDPIATHNQCAVAHHQLIGLAGVADRQVK